MQLWRLAAKVLGEMMGLSSIYMGLYKCEICYHNAIVY